MMPTNVAARMTLAADPGSLQGAVAAGILGCGPVILGTSEECARLLEAGAGQGGFRARIPRGRRGDRAAPSTTPASKAARLRASGPPAARPARRADPRAGRRARRERAARRARALAARRGGEPVGKAADDERVDADRGGDARPRIPDRGRQGRADPRPHRRSARPPSRGAQASARLPDGGDRGGVGRRTSPRRRAR